MGKEKTMKKLCKLLTLLFMVTVLCFTATACFGGDGSNPTPTQTPTPSTSTSASTQPTVVPTAQPTVVPSVTLSVAPSVMPSVAPSVESSVIPTAQPTVVPSVTPSVAPVAMRKITFIQAGFADVVVEVANGGSLTTLPTPKPVNGYTVTWNRTSFTNVTQDITAYAVTTLETYTVTYVLGGAENHVDNPTQFTIESPALPLTALEDSYGKNFGGWYTTPTFTEESRVSEIAAGSFGNITLYAKWLSYRIENADGFTMDYTKQPTEVTLTVPFTTENIDLNSRFVVSKGCNWRLYSDFTGLQEYPLKAMTLFVGDNIAYIIVFHPDGEHFTRYKLNVYRLAMLDYAFAYSLENVVTNTAQERSQISAPERNPEKRGHTFDGWFDGAQIASFPYTLTKEVVFTPVFTPISYPITYNLNGGTIENKKETYTVLEYFTFRTPTRDYYDFEGWYLNENFTGSTQTGVDIGSIGDITLYAKWTPVDYAITYHLDGGDDLDQNPKKYNVESSAITLKSPTKAGYTFKGWYKESTFTTPVTTIATGSHGKLDLYAKWQANTNTLKFDGNGATAGSMQNMQINTAATATLTANGFARPGYTFMGWAITADGEVEYENQATYTMGTDSEYTLYAVWQGNLNTLNFNGNGATSGEMQDMQIRSDATAVLTANGFTKTGYTFMGWATSASGSVAYENRATYTMGTDSEYTLYAVWELTENVITFDGNDATSGTMANQTVYKYGNKTLNTNAFSRPGYTFMGWAESASGAVKYQNGATVTFQQKEGYTLYAVWQANTNTLKFNGNGATSGSMANMQIKTNATATLTANGFARPGYTFMGWATSASGSVAYANGATYTMGTNSEYTLYAVWQANTNTLKFDGNGATSGTMASMKINTDATATLTANAFSRTGYTFMGWATTPTGVEEYANRATYTMGTDSEYTLYAVWEGALNTLHFNGNGATLGTMQDMQIHAGRSVTLTANTFAKAGYTFMGWATSASGNVAYANGATYTMGLNEVTLYAVWQANTNTLKFEGNGATSGEMADMQIKTNATATLTTNTFVKAGYTFKGWSTTASGNVEYTNGANYTMSTDAEYTLYAVWQVNTNTLKFDGNGATSGSMQNMQIQTGATATLTTNAFTKTGYTFVGWATSASGSVEYKNRATYTMGTSSTYTLYAVWQEPYTTGLKFTKNGSEYSVTDYTGSSTTVTIPGKYMNYPVTSIGYDAFYDCDSLTEIVIPASVTSIGDWAFDSCDSLTEIVIPNSVTSIGDYAFRDCDSLTTVTFGDNSQLTSIGNYAFYYCDSLTEIVIPNSVTSIGNSAFSSCDSLTEIVIPDSVTSIGNSAFSSCDSLTEIVIPDSVTSIGSSAFDECDSLTTVTFGDNSQLTSIGNYAFYYCDSLTEIVIPEGVTSIGEWAFFACYSLTIYCEAESQPNGWDSEWNYTHSNEVWGYQYVKQNGIMYGIKDGTATVVHQSSSNIAGSITIPASVTYKGTTYAVTSIGGGAFYNCTSLTEIVIPNSVTSIGSSAFRYCTSLTEIVIPNSVTSIGYYAFYNCTSLTEIVIPKGVTSIGDEAFSSCSSLTEIVIPNSVTSIGYRAFEYCSSLTEIVIPNSVTSIGYYAFVSCSSLTIYCEAASQPIGWNSDWNPSNRPVVWNCKNNDVATNGNIYTEQNGIRYALKDGIATVVEQSRNIAGNITIPASVTYNGTTYTVTRIGSSAFNNCDSLTEIVIPNSVTSIGSDAFSSCDSLTEIVIPDSVTSIGSDAFNSCNSLTKITFSDTSTWYRTTSSYNCNNKTGGTKTSVTTPITNATYFKSTYNNYYWYKL
ncbi:MAG: hypothetical protein E7363_01565 [Clostridiales bacterium]|nr:hypothetical protein [Clostridiales bacterium]